jgi:hypothetical protein
MPVGIGPRVPPSARGKGIRAEKIRKKPCAGLITESWAAYTNLKREWERPPFWCFGHLINTNGPGQAAPVMCCARPRSPDTRSDHGRSLASGMGPRDAYGCVPPGGDGRRAGGGEILQRPRILVRSKRKERDRRADDRPADRAVVRTSLRAPMCAAGAYAAPARVHNTMVRTAVRPPSRLCAVSGSPCRL